MPVSLLRSSSLPVKVITGCRASGSAPASAAGSSTDSPYAPLVCTSILPWRSAPVLASPLTRPGSGSSGTVSRMSWAAATTSSGLDGVRPSRSAAHRWEVSDTPLAATTR